MILLEDVCKRFHGPEGEVNALDGIHLQVSAGEFLIIRGPSGSGKSTLLLCLGGMLRPTRGHVWVDGSDLYAMGERKRALWRSNHVGFVFQMFHLVSYLNILENILLAGGANVKETQKSDALKLINHLGLELRMKHRPTELSVGEKQRTAMARALLNRPQIILADEPTGNLDPDHGRNLIDALVHFHHQGGTVVLVTHGTLADRCADRVLLLEKGCLKS